ncbi:MAG TPA: radical SAM protein [Candidatus Deferrimicrobiaceae bacterium]
MLNAKVLWERHRDARESLATCDLCPRACRVDRLSGRTGYCGAGALARVAAVSVHHGEEPPISGTRGSGTVFYGGCNMECIFCQNFPISKLGGGREMTVGELGDQLLGLQRKGAHNVNFVTPTPHVAHLIGALAHARDNGFALPVVYNTNGYDSMAGLSLLDGVVDIYLPDVKYRTGELAGAISGTADYPEHDAAAVAEMIRQVGMLETGEDGIARRGVLIRHLVLPGHVDETERVLSFIRESFGDGMPLSLMGQYFPAWKAHGRPGFDRKLTTEEYERAVGFADRLGLNNVFIQEL